MNYVIKKIYLTNPFYLSWIQFLSLFFINLLDLQMGDFKDAQVLRNLLMEN